MVDDGRAAHRICTGGAIPTENPRYLCGFGRFWCILRNLYSNHRNVKKGNMSAEYIYG